MVEQIKTVQTNRWPNDGLIKVMYDKHGNHCLYCKEPVPFKHITIDHFLPKSSGHKRFDNRVFSCTSCNAFKGHRSIEELKVLCLRKICKILRAISGPQKWKITDTQYRKIRKYTAILLTCDNIIKNNNKPPYVF